MRWYEPQHVLLGSKSYFAHTWGSIYVLSGEAAALLTAIQPSKLRYLSNEGGFPPHAPLSAPPDVNSIATRLSSPFAAAAHD